MTVQTREQSTTHLQKNEQSVMLAQLELFIRLGNMSDLDPKQHFARVLALGNALIEGDLALLQQALAFYANHTQLIFEHIGYLKRAFAHAGVTFQEPTIMFYEGPLGQKRCVVFMAIWLDRSSKIVFISSDPSIDSYVQAYTRNRRGAMTLEPVKEDPSILLQQISRVIRLPDLIGPPPFSSAGISH